MLIALVPLAAGCGDAKKAAAPPTLTHPEYVAQADAACRRADASLASLPQPTGVAQLPSYAKQAADIVADERAQLHALRAPAADQEKVAQLSAAMDAVVDVAQGLIVVAGGGDRTQIEAYVAQHRAADTRARQLAKELGLTACARA
jgi:hypothetical protein